MKKHWDFIKVFLYLIVTSPLHYLPVLLRDPLDYYRTVRFQLFLLYVMTYHWGDRRSTAS